ncbi:hypothetical protein [Propionivibrio sp.]|uniref:hypothetical protein n=1 Tax=Propionivibrio sp. TaxID=2212460 RepID=UPI003BF2F97A
MAEHRPLVLVDGRVRVLPIGDTLPGVSGASGVRTWKEPVSVRNGGDPQIVFVDSGDVVMNEVY